MVFDILTYQAIFHSTTIITIIVQIYATWLVQTKSPNEMKRYRAFLNFFSFWDITFTLFYGVLLTPEPVGRLFLIRGRGISAQISPNAQLLSYAGIIYCGTGMLIAQFLCLLYRFTIILDDNRYHNVFISKRSKLMLFLIGQTIMIGIACSIYSAFVSPENVPYHISIQPPEIQAYLIPGEFILWFDLTSTKARIYITIVVFLLVLLETLSAFLIYRILSILKDKSKNTKFSASTLKLNRQLTILLGVEFVTPLILVTIPLSINLVRVLIFNEFLSKGFAQIMFISIGFYGLANALFTIFFISPYRAHFLQTFFPWLNPVVSSSPIVRVSTTQYR